MTKDDRYGATDDDYSDDLDGYGTETVTTTDSSGETETVESNASEADSTDSTTDSTATSSDPLPFIFARRTVKADRDAVPVYVQDQTATEIDELERDLSQTFDGDKVMALDVREALIRAGLENVDDVRRVMEEWGYGRR
ncbi:hypothetical protein ZOD2009_06394 [Haladaptatus paucihalophilus DX253]|uniref:Uncharacterized protein n=1 Tax=Haladaptatus paucihalophilus DX253 TaxID=797209 RepID=E7QR56_HALPU|nr:hypothetical protein [Haladaptatus paucihalophilus]EFW92964.1 hypothetical protein ZOD2009_06394 [Haladaptatus paucihalophilus DX253]SHL18050.1 hypothetical protein SAMN05444342_3157 [Haladaptatus paucihalophilus DX253]